MGANCTTQEINMARLCPLCGQSLPTGLDEHAIHERLRKLAAPAISEERRTLEGQFNKRLERQRQQLKREAEQAVKARLLAAEKRARLSEQRQQGGRTW